MKIKKDIVWISLVLISFAMCIPLTASAWVACRHNLPDEHMDLSILTERKAFKTISQDILAPADALLFVWNPESSLKTTAPLYFSKSSPDPAKAFSVVLRI